MKGKILLVTGLAVGYVLGARAGREKYEKLKAAALNVWNDPRVQEQVDNVENFVKDKAPDVAEFVADGVKKVAATVTKRSDDDKPRARSTKRTTTGSSGARGSASGASGASRTAARSTEPKPEAGTTGS